MSRRVGVVVGVLVLLLLAVTVAAAVVAGRTVGGWLDDDRWHDRGGLVAAPTAEQVTAALRFGGFADLPAGAVAGPLRVEQGIDGLVVLRVRMAPGQVGPWLAASGLPAPVPSAAPVATSLGPDLPPGTPEIPQHRAGRPGGGVVWREGAVVAPGVVEVRAFET